VANCGEVFQGAEDMSEEANDGGSAFPAMLPGGNYCTPGMSLRDYFAGLAFTQLVYRREMTTEATYSRPELAEEAYCYADVMLKAKERQPDTTTAQHVALGIGGGK
jgi:hypothetical protein